MPQVDFSHVAKSPRSRLFAATLFARAGTIPAPEATPRRFVVFTVDGEFERR